MYDEPKTQVVEPETRQVAAQVEEKKELQTEEPFDKDRAMGTIHALREIEKKAKQDAKELETLKAEKVKRDEAEMTESQKLQKQAEEAKAENAKLRADLLRRDVIAETGLPAIFADRLQGATKDEMLADAEKLKAILPANTKTPPRIPLTNPADANNETEAELRKELFGQNSNPFDLNNIRQRGGGVFMGVSSKDNKE